MSSKIANERRFAFAKSMEPRATKVSLRSRAGATRRRATAIASRKSRPARVVRSTSDATRPATTAPQANGLPKCERTSVDPAESSPDRFCRVPPISAARSLSPVHAVDRKSRGHARFSGDSPEVRKLDGLDGGADCISNSSAPILVLIAPIVRRYRQQLLPVQITLSERLFATDSEFRTPESVPDSDLLKSPPLIPEKSGYPLLGDDNRLDLWRGLSAHGHAKGDVHGTTGQSKRRRRTKGGGGQNLEHQWRTFLIWIYWLQEAVRRPSEPPRRRGFADRCMIQALAYRLQEKAFGGLKPATRRLLESVAGDAGARRPIAMQSEALRSKPGRYWSGSGTAPSIRLPS